MGPIQSHRRWFHQSSNELRQSHGPDSFQLDVVYWMVGCSSSWLGWLRSRWHAWNVSLLTCNNDRPPVESLIIILKLYDQSTDALLMRTPKQ